MQIPNIKETNLTFLKLYDRYNTNLIVLHHSAAPPNHGATDIHRWHLQAGYAGIGYHFVIRQDGTIEQGRPLNTIGAHSYGQNSNSVGICFCGNYDFDKLTARQIEIASMLIAYIGLHYNVPICRYTVVGHQDLIATDCPGKNIINMLDNGTLTGKAIWYQQH